MRKITHIAIHHSASSFGDVKTFRRWHTKGRGWSDIGYHAVVLNGCRQSGEPVSSAEIGALEPGRPIERVGAHVRGENTHSLGLCLVGNFEDGPPHPKQWHAATRQAAEWCRRFRVPPAKVLGHREFRLQATACPGRHLDMDRFRADVAALMAESPPPSTKPMPGETNHEREIRLARQQLMALGITDGSRPDYPVTRAELWVQLVRLQGVLGD
jgi:N-acetylmuramoyl-L-alanine amidase